MKNGFTVVEALMVSLIIGVLAAVLFPIFAKAREKAVMASCQNNLRQISIALTIYARDCNGHLPPKRNDFRPLMPYLAEREVICCPHYIEAARIKGTKLSQLPTYLMAGGLTLDMAPRILVARDRNLKEHISGCNVLFLDGHVKWMRDNHLLNPRTLQPIPLGKELPEIEPEPMVVPRGVVPRGGPAPPGMGGQSGVPQGMPPRTPPGKAPRGPLVAPPGVTPKAPITQGEP